MTQLWAVHADAWTSVTGVPTESTVFMGPERTDFCFLPAASLRPSPLLTVLRLLGCDGEKKGKRARKEQSAPTKRRQNGGAANFIKLQAGHSIHITTALSSNT